MHLQGTVDYPLPDDVKQRPSAGKWTDFDAAIDHIGVGRAQYLIMLVCGMANVSDAVGVYSLSFLIPSEAECTLKLHDARKSWLAMGLFAGMMVGSWFWGWVSDARGRRGTLRLALAVNCAAAVAAAAAPSFAVLMALEVVAGAGLGGSLPIVLTYYSEFVPAAHRGRLVSLLGSLWMVGSLVVTGLAWGLLGTTECARHSTDGRPWEEVCAAYANHTCGFSHVGGADWTVETWRIFQLACSLCPLLAIGGLYFAPESPQWLFAHGRHVECRVVLTALARRNGKTLPLDSDCAEGQALLVRGEGEPHDRLSLWRSPLRTKLHLLITAAIWATLSFGFYGFSMWRPAYFLAQSGSAADSYWLSFIVAAGALPGNVVSVVAMDRVGHKACFVISGLLSSALILGVLLVRSSLGMTIFSTAFSAVTVVSWNALDVLGPELFPTELRATAFGLQNATGRLFSIFGQLVFGLFSGSAAVIPLSLTVSALTMGSLLALALPSTTGKHTH